MTARVYGVISLLPRVGRETGFSSVSATHSAVALPVMMSTDTPPPGSCTCSASCMAAEASEVAPQISFETAGGRLTPAVVRLISMPAMTGLLSLSLPRYGEGSEELICDPSELLGRRGGPVPCCSLRAVGLGSLRAALRGEVGFAGNEVTDRLRALLGVHLPVVVDLELGRVDECESVCRVL